MLKFANIHFPAQLDELNSKINDCNFFIYFILPKFKMASKMAAKKLFCWEFMLKWMEKHFPAQFNELNSKINVYNFLE